MKLRLHCPLRALIFSLFLREERLAQYQKHFRKKGEGLYKSRTIFFILQRLPILHNLPKYTVLPDMINVHIKKLSASVDVFSKRRRIFCPLPDKLKTEHWNQILSSRRESKSFLLPIGKSEARKGLKSRTHISLKRRLGVWVKPTF